MLRIIFAIFVAAFLPLPLHATFAAPVAAPAVQIGCSTEVTSALDSGAGSLRSALACAPVGSTITFASTFNVPRTITLTTPITIKDSIIISGPGSSRLTISGANVTRTLFINAGAAGDVRLFGLTLANGRVVGGDGGAVYVQTARSLILSDTRIINSAAVSTTLTNGQGGGLYVAGVLPLTLVNSQITSNTAGTNYGGLFTSSALTMTGSTIAANSAGSRDYGGFLTSGALTMISSTVASNVAGQDIGGFSATGPLTMIGSQVLSNTARAGQAGGVYIGKIATIANSTIASNTAPVGGGIVAAASLVVSNSTIAANAATIRAGGISLTTGSSARFIHVSVVSNSAPSAASIFFNSAGPHFFTNTIVGGAAAGQCAGTTTRQDFSSISNDMNCGLRTVPSIGVGLLGAYGGSQPTAPLVAGSPALDAAAPAACPPRDQRGLTRAGVCDVGAYESRGFGMGIVSGSSQETRVGGDFPEPLAVRFSSSAGEPLGPGGVLYVAGPVTGATISPSSTFVLVDAQGWVSIPLRAGNSIGFYGITVTAAGATPVRTSLRNLCSPVVWNTSDSGPGSLRDAVVCAVNNSTVTFDPAAFNVPRTITLTDQIHINKSLVISGPGSSRVTISGNNVTRTLDINAGSFGHVQLFGLTLANGYVRGNGGAVHVQTANSVTISDTRILNSAVISSGNPNLNDGMGGGLHIAFQQSAIILNLVDSEIAFNTAERDGGGFNTMGEVRMTGTRVHSNRAGVQGGGIATLQNFTMADSQVLSNTADTAGGMSAGSAGIVNSTIAWNTANFIGGISGGTFISNSTIAANAATTSTGGIRLNASARLIHVSIVSNSAPTAAGINFLSNVPHFFTNTIVGGAATGQCTGAATKHDFSSISNDANCGLRTVPSVGVGRLGSYGGGQPTVPLVAGSPALDAADPAACPTRDQRGLTRVGACDVGAYESRGGFSMALQGGAVQTTTAGAIFPTPLVVRFFSNNGEPLGPGGVLAVASPAAGASLAPSTTFGLVDAQGWVTLPLTAGSASGAYPITISANSIASTFPGRMTNIHGCSNTVTNTLDAGRGSLRDAVACEAAGSNITFDPATFSVPRIITLTSPIVISRSLVISGAGSSRLAISGNDVTRTLFISVPLSAGDVRLYGMTLTRGRVYGDGGAILVRNVQSLVLSDTQILNNRVMTTTASDGRGGGLYGIGIPALTIIDSQVLSNTAVYDGAFSGFNSLTLTGSTVAFNTSVRAVGGFDVAKLTMVNSQVLSNTSNTGVGGFEASSVTMVGSTIAFNQAPGGFRSGGFWATGPTILTDSTIAFNTATGDYGGGFAAFKALTMTNVTVTSNTARKNGGFYADSTVMMSNSRVTSNRANDVGGFHASDAVTMNGSQVLSNTANGDYGGFEADWHVRMTETTVASNVSGADYGGFQAKASLTMVRSTVASNTAGLNYGGFRAGTTSMISATIASNTAGRNYGGFQVGDVSIISSMITSNTAGVDSGGFQASTTSMISATIASNTAGQDYGGFQSTSVSMSGSSVLSNTAGRDSGGFYAWSVVTMINSQVRSNTAVTNAGGFRADGDVTMIGSTIASNTAGRKSGGFETDDDWGSGRGSVTMISSTIASNTAGEYVGGFRALTTTLISSAVVSNSAGFGIGGFHTQGAVSISHSLIAANSAGRAAAAPFFTTRVAGGIYLTGSRWNGKFLTPTVTIADSTIASNTAPIGGGIVANGKLVISNSTIAANEATISAGGISLTEGSTAHFLHVSVVSNSAPNAAGIFFNDAGPHFFTSTIVGGAAASQCAGTATKQNSFSISNDANCGLRTVPSVGVGRLGAHGGGRPTAQLVAGSPALDAADPAACPALDQRGLTRVGACDVGAYESRGGFSMAIQSGAVQTTTTGATFPAPLVVRFFSSAGEPLGPGGMLSVAGPAAGASLAPSVTFGLVDAQGWVTLALTAGSAAGTYPITITAAGIAAPTFGSLTNTVSGSPTPTPVSTPTPNASPTPSLTPTPSINDDIAQPLVISQLPYSATLNVAAATTAQNDPVLPCEGSALYRTVWYRFTSSAAERVQISTAGSTYDTVLAVFSGAPGSLSPIACNDDHNGSPQSSVNVKLITGTTYYIEVASFDDVPAGSLTLSVQRIQKPSRKQSTTLMESPVLEASHTPTLDPSSTPTPGATHTPTLDPSSTPTPGATHTPTLDPSSTPTPGATHTPTLDPSSTPTPTKSFSNDEATQPLVVNQLPYTVTFDASTAASILNGQVLPCVADATLRIAWFRYTPNTSELVQITALGSTFDTALAVFRSDPASLRPVACDYDSGAKAGGASIAVVAMESGVSYLIAAAAPQNATGLLTLELRACDAACQPPSSLMSAQAITLAADIAAGGTLTAESGITFIVPSQSSLSSPETMEIAYMPLHWPAPEPGETPMHVFHLDVAITGSTVPSLPNPAEVVIQMDLTTVPAGHRAWLLEWSSPAGWTLVPEQRYDPLSGVLTVRTDRPGIYGLITAEFPDIRLPSFS